MSVLNANILLGLIFMLATAFVFSNSVESQIEDSKKLEPTVSKSDFPSEAKNHTDNSEKPEPSAVNTDPALETKNNAELKLANKLYNTRNFSEALKHFRTVA